MLDSVVNINQSIFTSEYPSVYSVHKFIGTCWILSEIYGYSILEVKKMVQIITIYHLLLIFVTINAASTNFVARFSVNFVFCELTV